MIKLTLILMLCSLSMAHLCNAQNNDAYFKFHLKPGQQTGTVFMGTIAISSPDFSELVSRVSGTGDYTVKQATADSASFDAIFRVDGHPASKLQITISDEGRVIAFSGKKSRNHEGSGLAFNAFLWGTPPAHLKTGDTWNVTIDNAWESGGPGWQKVTVLYTDPANHTICLSRYGESEGFYEAEGHELSISKDGKPIKVMMSPGKTNWTGYTIFKDGLIFSDELMAERPLKLITPDGKVYIAQQREYMTLNAKPFDNGR